MNHVRKSLALLLMLSFFATTGTTYATTPPETKAQNTKNTPPTTPKTKKPANWYDGFMFKTPCCTFEFIRLLGSAYGQGADLGECIQTALKIKDGDDTSWFKEWKEKADYVKALADGYAAKGHMDSARSAYMRACNYYRSAGFFMHAPQNLPKALETSKLSRQCFKNAIKGLKNVTEVAIPYEKTTLPGYLVTPQTQSKAPLLIVHSGFDGTGEELYFQIAKAAAQRGYNCLIFEGPGQGAVIRTQNIPFRPDWENVVTPVVDYAVGLDTVDSNKIALLGYSMGGYLAPRAAAFEKRIKVCIADGGVYDFYDTMTRNMPPDFLALAYSDPDKFNQDMYDYMKTHTQVRWAFYNGIWTFGVKTPAQYVSKMRAYTLEKVAKQISCHMLVIDSTADMFMKGEAQKLFNALECPKELLVFGPEQTAQAHCQMGAGAVSAEMILNRLDEILNTGKTKE